MKTRTTITLLVLFFGALLAYWWADYAHWQTNADRVRWKGRVLPELSEVRPQDIRRVEITGPKTRLVFERSEGDRWQMTAPLEVLADRGRLDALVTNLQSLATAPDAIAIAGPLARFGLEPPAHTVRLFGTKSQEPTATLDVGGRIQDRRYVRGRQADRIEVVDAKLLGDLDAPAVAWREKALFNAFPFDVQHLAVRGAGRDLDAERTDEGWKLLRPFRAPGDEEKLDGIVADLTALQVAGGIQGFVADDVRDLTAYGLQTPALTVELATRSRPSQPLVLHVGKAVPGEPEHVYAQRGDQDDVLKVDARVLTSLGKTARELRSIKAVGLAPDRVQFLRLTAEGIEHELAKGADGWHVLAPRPGRADPRAVQDFLARLAGLRVSVEDSAGGPPPAPSLDRPMLVVRAWEGQAPSADVPLASLKPTRDADVVFRLGRFDRRRVVVYGQLEGDPTVLALPETARSLVPKGELAYLERGLLSLPLGSIDQITVRHGESTVELALAGGPGDPVRWRMVNPVQAPADAASLVRLEPLLTRLRAENLVTDAAKDLKAYGLDAPTMTLRWRSREKGAAAGRAVPAGASYSLLLGAFVPDSLGSRYAKFGDDLSPLVFTVSPEALAILGAELHSHTVLAFPEGQVARVILSRAGTSLTYARQEKPFAPRADWTLETGAPAPGMTSERVDALVKMLSNLTTQRFVQYSGPIPRKYGLAEPQLRVEVELSGGLGTRVLRLGSRGPESTWLATAETGDSGAVVLLPMMSWTLWLSPPAPGGELPANVFAPEGAPGGAK
jgi:hypothetical protein